MMMVTAQGWSGIDKRSQISLAVFGAKVIVLLFTVFTGAVQPMF